MATLISAGASVSVSDESFYSSAGNGTVPLIVLATAANKVGPSGTDIASRTVSGSQALLMATSQRDVIQALGTPLFKSINGTPVHADETNEYGLHAAYSYTGISTPAYLLRADIDLAQLEPSISAPNGPPVAGTYWFDLAATNFGLFRSNGNASAGLAWESKTVLVATANDIDGSNVPKTTFGTNGDYAVVPQTTSNFLYEKTAGTWNRVGSNAWKTAHPTVVRGSSTPTLPLGTAAITINGQAVTLNNAASVASIAGTITSANIPSLTATVDSGALVLTNTAGGDLTISGTALTALGFVAGTTTGNSVKYTNNAQYPANSRAGDLWVKFTAPNRGAVWSVKMYSGTTASWVSLDAPFYAFNSAALDGAAGKDSAALAANSTPLAGSIYVGFDASTGVMEIRRFAGSSYQTAVYEASVTTPVTTPPAGTLWYSADLRVDVMVGNGVKWQGYQNRYPNSAGVIVAGSAPTTQPDGTSLVAGDLWLNSADLENYPRMYRWDTTALRWKVIDNTDQTTPFGIVFADARADSGPTFTGIPNSGSYSYESEEEVDMLLSDYVDPDAPDARTHPDGTLLFNTRYSTYNVKEWKPNFFDLGGFDANTDFTYTSYTNSGATYSFPATTAGRWVTVSGNKTDGSPYMGRKAQRIMVVRAMAEALVSNEDIRSEAVNFNLIAAPGYPELLDEMIALNVDIKQTAFVVGDTPARLKPTGSDITAWAQNTRNASGNGEDGLVSSDTYTGIYYPWGLGTNSDGSSVMIPPSTIALRTIAYSDASSYPWFAPAGLQRGLVTNAESVGYLTSEGEYRAVTLNGGLRDACAMNKINPIAYMMGRGLFIMEQRTLHPVSSALDRINVARLVNYLRLQLNDMVLPFLFQPNDLLTREAARITVERFLAGLVGQRGLEDFAVVCDGTNNTAARVARKELWIDVVIKPINAVEFIYIPLRVRNSGDSLDI